MQKLGLGQCNEIKERILAYKVPVGEYRSNNDNTAKTQSETVTGDPAFSCRCYKYNQSPLRFLYQSEYSKR